MTVAYIFGGPAHAEHRNELSLDIELVVFVSFPLVRDAAEFLGDSLSVVRESPISFVFDLADEIIQDLFLLERARSKFVITEFI